MTSEDELGELPPAGGVESPGPIAVHEAAHTILNSRFGFATRRVSIVADAASGTLGHSTASGTGPHEADSRLEEVSYQGPEEMDTQVRRWVERRVITSLAGPEADIKLGRSDSEVSVGAGLVELPEPITVHGEEVTHALRAGGDYTFVQNLMEKVTAGDDELAMAWVEMLRIRTARLVALHWDVILYLAQALQERQTLNKTEITALLAEQSKAVHEGS